MWCGSHLFKKVVVVQSPSRVQLFATPWPAARQASLSLTISQSLPKFVSIALVMPSSQFILWRPAFFMVQLSQPYVTTGKTRALTIPTFVGRVMSLLFNILDLSQFSCQSSDFVASVTIHSDFRAQEEEICHCFHIFPFYLP